MPDHIGGLMRRHKYSVIKLEVSGSSLDVLVVGINVGDRGIGHMSDVVGVEFTERCTVSLATGCNHRFGVKDNNLGGNIVDLGVPRPQTDAFVRRWRAA